MYLQDYSQQPPAQELIARDLHDNEWKFRHIFRGGCEFVQNSVLYLLSLLFIILQVCTSSLDAKLRPLSASILDSSHTCCSKCQK